MTWTPPHDNFTTFVKDDNNIYIKCADGSWVVLTLGPNPVGPFGKGVGPQKRKPRRYIYLEEKWEILGKRAITGELSSKVIGEPSEILVLGIRLEGKKSKEVRNVFNLIAILADSNSTTLTLLGTKSEYLDKEVYVLGKKAEYRLKISPVFGDKVSSVEKEYEMIGTATTEEVINSIIEGIKSEEIKEITLASGKVSEIFSISKPIDGSKVSMGNKKIKINGKKDFSMLIELLLTEV